ncbi:hypothetical protein DO967_24665, partial [Salmonella enterica subsp. salamae]|nr:hypothetical protein [Salmonella enterica subsp. salamae]ECG1232652.1 hypothetical protein [Salmonella enterica subsp. salamae]ECI3324155.1 hypothetical protein [Salmonella enterica subsp. salamae]
MAVSGRSDFQANLKFPEVYHARGITTPLFYGDKGAVTGQGENTTYGGKSSVMSRYILCFVAAARREGEEDP